MSNPSLNKHKMSVEDSVWMEKNVPCQFACPTRTDVPAYLSAISKGELEEAYKINLISNVFPAVLGRVCTRPCEAVCRHGWPGLGESVSICFSKRTSGDFNNLSPLILPHLFPSTGKKVAIIGAGPAGLSAARDLALWGHEVCVYEKHEKPGGMLVQGIPPFRLPRKILSREIEQIESLGVKIKTGITVGTDISLQALRENFNAIILAPGATKSQSLNIPGENLEGVEYGLPFLKDVISGKRNIIGKRVIIIGGGFTAVDCARVARRLGARSVNIFYRRTHQEMRLTPGEYESLIHEGSTIYFNVAPKAILGKNDKVEKIRFIKTELDRPCKNENKPPVEIPDSTFERACDTVLLAIGQVPDASRLGSDVSQTIFENEFKGVFVAGDFALGASSVIDAIGQSKECARKVDTYLMGKERFMDRVHIEEDRQSKRSRNLDFIPRQVMPEAPLKQRNMECEVEQGFDEKKAHSESSRCYLCHYKYEIDTKRCIYCDLCCEVKPRDHCIVKIKGLRKDEEGRILELIDREVNFDPDSQFHYFINQEDCIRCNACLEVCPVNCIKVQKVSFSTDPVV